MLLKVYNNEYFRNYDTFKTFEEVHRIKYKYKHKTIWFILTTKCVELSNMNLQAIAIINKEDLLILLDIPPMSLIIIIQTETPEDIFIFLYDKGFLSKVHYLSLSKSFKRQQLFVKLLLFYMKEIHHIYFIFDIDLCFFIDYKIHLKIHIISFRVGNVEYINKKEARKFKILYIRGHDSRDYLYYKKNSHDGKLEYKN